MQNGLPTELAFLKKELSFTKPALLKSVQIRKKYKVDWWGMVGSVGGLLGGVYQLYKTIETNGLRTINSVIKFLDIIPSLWDMSKLVQQQSNQISDEFVRNLIDEVQGDFETAYYGIKKNIKSEQNRPQIGGEQQEQQMTEEQKMQIKQIDECLNNVRLWFFKANTRISSLNMRSRILSLNSSQKQVDFLVSLFELIKLMKLFVGPGDELLTRIDDNLKWLAPVIIEKRMGCIKKWRVFSGITDQYHDFGCSDVDFYKKIVQSAYQHFLTP